MVGDRNRYGGGGAGGYLTWLGAPVFVWLGGISYTLHLLHENIGWTVIGRLEGAGIPANLAILAAIATSVGLAALVTYLVERPAMRWIRGFYRSRAPRPGTGPRVILRLEPGIPPGGGASGP
ncbi:acyltransferase family protein [Neoroseomonas lacus]|uniref:Uncharacterized protein n=1 Tax=Neoroseomonas lacus TaxID=287609 RepID=A0A917NY85_9PROT|nr:hypothetical protein [Neoroseomonas lacus]GGJ40170.1 hypothetical protein GCM10011320_54720 [Neoroseomonas lacus]